MTTTTDLDPRFSGWVGIATNPEAKGPELLCRTNPDDPATETRILITRSPANEAFQTDGMDDCDVLTLAVTCWERTSGNQALTAEAQPLIHIADLLGEEYATAAFGPRKAKGMDASIWTILINHDDNHPHPVLACGGWDDDEEDEGDPLDWIA